MTRVHVSPRLEAPVIPLAQLGAVLGRAFDADPLVVHVDPEPRGRARRFGPVYTACLRHAARWGGVLSDPMGRGAVGWVPGERMRVDVLDGLRSGYIGVPFALGPCATARLVAHEHACETRLAARLRPGAAYLYVVGVDPSSAGLGIGGRLLRAALAQMAGRHTSCLLKTETPRNVDLYLHLGFEVVETWVVPSSGVQTWIFERALDPAGAAARPSTASPAPVTPGTGGRGDG